MILVPAWNHIICSSYYLPILIGNTCFLKISFLHYDAFYSIAKLATTINPVARTIEWSYTNTSGGRRFENGRSDHLTPP